MQWAVREGHNYVIATLLLTFYRYTLKVHLSAWGTVPVKQRRVTNWILAGLVHTRYMKTWERDFIASTTLKLQRSWRKPSTSVGSHYTFPQNKFLHLSLHLPILTNRPLHLWILSSLHLPTLTNRPLHLWTLSSPAVLHLLIPPLLSSPASFHLPTLINWPLHLRILSSPAILHLPNPQLHLLILSRPAVLHLPHSTGSGSCI